MNESTKEKSVKQGTKTIVLNISESDYPCFLMDLAYTKQVINQALTADSQEKRFPQGSAEGWLVYQFNDGNLTKKL